MCGIAGILHLDTTMPSGEAIRRMTTAMAHRGPDAEGSYIDDRIAIGHLRLSIIDLSDTANQPLSDPTGRYQIIFNGEIYNYQEVKQMLSGYPFKTNGDTEVILAAYTTWGANCLQMLKGMFAIVIWDSLEKQLFIARDRMGVKPLYYYKSESHLVFASEIRGLLASDIVPRKVNTRGVREFLSYQSVGSTISMIENVHQLPAGSYMTVKGNELSIIEYWSLIHKNVSDFDFSNRQLVLQHIRDLLRNAVESRLISDVPVGAFLSGGIDSSAIVGLMAEVRSTPPSTFTIGFDEKEFDESDYATMVAKRFNTRHSSVKMKPANFLDELYNALNAMDTPSGDGINTYVVSKAIRHHGLRVAVSGVGGDELFAGYSFFKLYLKLKRFQQIWPATRWARNASAALLSLKSSSKTDRIGRLLKSESCSIDYFYPEFRRIITPEMLGKLTSWNNQSSALEFNLQKLGGGIGKFPLLSQVSIAEYLGYTQHTLLKDTDQMSMAVSLEVREPFFDHDLVSFVLSIPDSLKYPAYPKSLLVESLQNLLPSEVVHRPKQGFLFPWKNWMKNELRSFCDQHIRHMAERDFINGNNLLAYWSKFLKEDSSVRWMELWLFIVLEYWLEKNEVQ